jgi:hypothetical protein
MSAPNFEARLPTNEAEALYVHVRASLATPSLNREDNQMITRHRYTVKPEYVAQNRQNLDEFIAALTAASVPGLSYRVFLEEDGQTFLHLVISRDDPSAVITGLPSFKKFQSELLASDPVVRPDQVGMSLVATSGDSYG